MNLDDYRYSITYNVADWERIAQTSGDLCAPARAVRAVNALCDEVERNRAAIDELVGALKARTLVRAQVTTERKSMTDDELMDIARPFAANGGRWPSDWIGAMRAAVEKEREACAKVCDRHADNQARHGDMVAAEQSRQDALAIRSITGRTQAQNEALISPKPKETK